MRASIRPVLIATIVLAASCGNGSGVRCTSSSECQGGLVCATASGAGRDGGGADAPMRLCMRLCDYDAGDGVEQRLCSDGAACLLLEGMRVCYVGGNHAIHSACEDDVQCEAGTICAPDTHLCTQACTVGHDGPCDANEVCADVGGGLCRAPAIVTGDAGP